jgi:hypothetical protein
MESSAMWAPGIDKRAVAFHQREMEQSETRRLALRRWSGLSAVVVAGTCWALLCGMLALHGHAPSRAGLWLEPRHQYAAQAGFVIPLLTLQWLLCCGVTARLLRTFGAQVDWIATANRLAFALALPLIGLLLVPDLVVYAALGFGALGKLLRVTGPLCLLASIATATLALRALVPLSTARVCAASTLGVLAQALLGGLWLR